MKRFTVLLGATILVSLSSSVSFGVPLSVYESAGNDPAKQSQLLKDAYETSIAKTVTALRDTHFTDGKEKTPERCARDRLRAERIELIAGHLTDKQSGDLIVMIERYATAQPNTELDDVIVSFLLTEAAKPIIPQGMEIQQFDRLTSDDQLAYIAVLIERAQDMLNLLAKDDLAARVKQLFTFAEGQDHGESVGLSEFKMNLARARAVDAQNVDQDPNARRLEVEDAMAMTLKSHDIEMPDTFYAYASDFKPKPPQQ